MIREFLSVLVDVTLGYWCDERLFTIDSFFFLLQFKSKRFVHQQKVKNVFLRTRVCTCVRMCWDFADKWVKKAGKSEEENEKKVNDETRIDFKWIVYSFDCGRTKHGQNQESIILLLSRSVVRLSTDWLHKTLAHIPYIHILLLQLRLSELFTQYSPCTHTFATHKHSSIRNGWCLGMCESVLYYSTGRAVISVMCSSVYERITNGTFDW